MCGTVPIKFLLPTELHDEKLHHGSKEDGIMLRKGPPNSDVEVVIIHYIGCSSLGHPAFGRYEKLARRVGKTYMLLDPSPTVSPL